MASETGSVRSLRASRRLPSRLLAPSAFPGLVIATFVAIYVNVVSGALVRVTNSGPRRGDSWLKQIPLQA